MKVSLGISPVREDRFAFCNSCRNRFLFPTSQLLHMKFKYFLVPVLAIISCGVLQAQNADTAASPTPGFEHHHHWRHHHHAWIWKKLNLTDAQKAQIKSIRQTMKSQTRPALVAVLQAKMQLHQDINTKAGQPSVDAAALTAAEVQLATVRAAELSQIKTVLTPEQQTTLADFQQKRTERMKSLISKLSQPTS
jgi:protein CpxP